MQTKCSVNLLPAVDDAEEGKKGANKGANVSDVRSAFVVAPLPIRKQHATTRNNTQHARNGKIGSTYVHSGSTRIMIQQATDACDHAR